MQKLRLLDYNTQRLKLSIQEEQIVATKSIVLVIGVGRSGTSAITRVLSLCGCGLSNSVLGSLPINERGFWEPTEIWRLNDEFMFRHGSFYTDPRLHLQETMSIKDCDSEIYIKQVQSFLSGLDQEKVSIVKHPNITELMPLWLEATSREGIVVKVVIPIRHPQEVFASIAATRGQSLTTSVEFTNAFWLKQNLLAERHSRGLPRVFIEYSSFLMNWRLEISRVAKALELDLKPQASAIEGFLTPALLHQRFSGPVVETFGFPWITRVYAALSAAARDEELSLETMEEIYHAYRVNERAFRIAQNEFRIMFDSIEPQAFYQSLEQEPVFKKGVDYG